jgi:AcrR family transcriptional regulator
MPRPKTISDDELLGVAREVFRERGHSASTRDVAAAAGISEAVLYKRFGSKEALFRRAMIPASADIDALLGPYPPRSAKADLTRILERLVAFFAEHMATVLSVVTHPDLHGSHMRAFGHRMPFADLETALAARLRRMQGDGLVGNLDADAAAGVLVRAAHASAFARATMGPHAGGDPAAMVAVVWNGLSPRRLPNK